MWERSIPFILTVRVKIAVLEAWIVMWENIDKLHNNGLCLYDEKKVWRGGLARLLYTVCD